MSLPILIVCTLSMSHANKCCKSVTISSTNSFTKQNQAGRLTTFKRHTEINGTPSYLSSDNATILYYSETTQNWSVGEQERSEYIRIKSGKCTRYVCPSDAKNWEYFHYKDGPDSWRADSTLTVTCNQELTAARATATPPINTSKTTDSVPKTLVIGGSVGGGICLLFVIIIIAFCVWRYWKSRQSNQEDIDNNPVYGVYGDVYEEIQIYDRNAYYATTETEDTGTTMIRDNNSQYE